MLRVFLRYDWQKNWKFQKYRWDDCSKFNASKQFLEIKSEVIRSHDIYHSTDAFMITATSCRKQEDFDINRCSYNK